MWDQKNPNALWHHNPLSPSNLGSCQSTVRVEGEFKKSAWDFQGSRTRTTATKRHSVSWKQRFEMRLCEPQCYLALLGLSLVLCGRSANSQLEPELDFHHRRLLQRASATGQATQVSLKWTLTKYGPCIYLLDSGFQLSACSKLPSSHSTNYHFQLWVNLSFTHPHINPNRFKTNFFCGTQKKHFNCFCPHIQCQRSPEQRWTPLTFIVWIKKKNLLQNK